MHLLVSSEFNIKKKWFFIISINLDNTKIYIAHSLGTPSSFGILNIKLCCKFLLTTGELSFPHLVRFSTSHYR